MELEHPRVSLDTPPGGKPTQRDDLDGVDINLVPDEVWLALKPPEEEAMPARMKPLWHHVALRPGALVSLWSRDDRVRVMRLAVQSDAPGWNPHWVRWSYPIRHVSDDHGGAAMAAQDRVENGTLTLLVLPEDHRNATLEFDVALDGYSAVGDYGFDVVLEDTEDGTMTSVPGVLKVRHPQSDLIKRLPAIYTADTPQDQAWFGAPFADAPFFERFLRGFEDAMEPTQKLLGNLDQLFDPYTAPRDFLPWLAGWVSLALDENWPQLKRRLLIKEAVELYRWRGTRHGLSRYLEIYSDVIPEINDKPFEGMRLGPDTLLGFDTILGDVPHHTFVVTLAVPDIRTVNERIVRDIIELQKPAHTSYDVRIVERAVESAAEGLAVLYEDAETYE